MKTVLTGIVNKLGVALVLAAMTAGVAAASASATLPEYVLSSAATISAKGGAMTLETTAAEEGITRSVQCKTTFGEMETEGKTHTKEFTGSFSFTGCKELGPIGGTCTGPGSAEGTIKTSTMKMHLFYLAGSGVGLVLNYKSTGEVATFETFTCVVLGISKKFTARGTSLAQITPLNTKTNKFTVTLTGSKGVPTLKEYKNESGVKVTTKLEVQRDTGVWEAGDLNSASLFFELGEPVAEIKA